MTAIASLLFSYNPSNIQDLNAEPVLDVTIFATVKVSSVLGCCALVEEEAFLRCFLTGRSFAVSLLWSRNA